MLESTQSIERPNFHAQFEPVETFQNTPSEQYQPYEQQPSNVVFPLCTKTIEHIHQCDACKQKITAILHESKPDVNQKTKPLNTKEFIKHLILGIVIIILLKRSKTQNNN